MRELREEPGVTDAVDTACEMWPRAEDAWESITWAIARDPFLGRALNESGELRNIVWDGAASIGMPDVSVIYRISDPTIEILNVEFTEPKAREAGHG